MEEFIGRVIWGDQSTGLVIPWAETITYVTITALSAGAVLIILSNFLKTILVGDKELSTDAWAMGFGVPGLILFITGLHFTLTWPLGLPFFHLNIIFGETSFALGVLALAVAFYLWKRGDKISSAKDPAVALVKMARPVAPFITGLGLATFAIAFVSIAFGLYAAPAEEPITGITNSFAWVETWTLAILWILIGLGAVLAPFAFKPLLESGQRNKLQIFIVWAWRIPGYFFLVFAALNFYNHVGLILNTQM